VLRRSSVGWFCAVCYKSAIVLAATCSPSARWRVSLSFLVFFRIYFGVLLVSRSDGLLPRFVLL
jgi:hypothetical protein